MDTVNCLRSCLVWLATSLLTGCTDLTHTLGALASDPALKPQVSDAVNWVAVNFAHTALGRSIPLREQPDQPIDGRWILTGFKPRAMPDHTLEITIEGYGYIGHKVARNVTFTGHARVRYATEVAQDSDWLFVFFRPIAEPAVAFQPQRVDGILADLFRGLVISGGEQKMRDRVGSGFTVAWKTGEPMRMMQGVPAPGARPTPPPTAGDAGVTTLADETVRLHEDGMDFLGPFQLQQGDRLELSVNSSSTWGLDAWLMEDDAAHKMLLHHFDPKKHALPTVPVLASSQGTVPWKTEFTAPRNLPVFLVLDNTDAGNAKPPGNGVDDILTAAIKLRLERR